VHGLLKGEAAHKKRLTLQVLRAEGIEIDGLDAERQRLQAEEGLGGAHTGSGAPQGSGWRMGRPL